MSQKSKILRVESPVARKPHVCGMCGGAIRKGETYKSVTLVYDGRITSEKRHIRCHESKKTLTEEDFRKEMSMDAKMMSEAFSFQESMEIAFFPLVIAEIAWHYAGKVRGAAASERIDEVKKLSRAVKMLEDKYKSDILKDLPLPNYRRITDETKVFIRECSTDFSLLYYSVKHDIWKGYGDIQYVDMRALAYICLVVIDAMKEHNRRMNALISERTGGGRLLSGSIHPVVLALEDCMKAYMSPVEYIRSIHADNFMNIMLNKINKCQFVVKK